MQFNAFIRELLSEYSSDKIIPTSSGVRSGYVVTMVLFNELLDDIYDQGKYPMLYSVEKIEESFLKWGRFDVAAQTAEEAAPMGIYVFYSGKSFKEALQALDNYLNRQERIRLAAKVQQLRSFKSELLQEVDRLSEIQGTFVVYEDGATSQPYISFAVEIDQGYYRSQQLNNDLKDVDTTGFEDLL